MVGELPGTGVRSQVGWDSNWDRLMETQPGKPDIRLCVSSSQWMAQLRAEGFLQTPFCKPSGPYWQYPPQKMLVGKPKSFHNSFRAGVVPGRGTDLGRQCMAKKENSHFRWIASLYSGRRCSPVNRKKIFPPW